MQPLYAENGDCDALLACWAFFWRPCTAGQVPFASADHEEPESDGGFRSPRRWPSLQQLATGRASALVVSGAGFPRDHLVVRSKDVTCPCIHMIRRPASFRSTFWVAPPMIGASQLLESRTVTDGRCSLCGHAQCVWNGCAESRCLGQTCKRPGCNLDAGNGGGL